MTRNEARRQIARNPKAGKLPHGVGTESQSWKASPRRGHGIPKLENFPTAWAQNPKAGKLPHSVGAESQGWKASPQRGHGIPRLESFPTAWARNPKAGKLPHGVGTESQGWKVSPQCGHEIPKLENFPTAWAQNPKAGKLPHGVGTESRQSTVGAYRIRPNTHTYPRGCFRAYTIRPYNESNYFNLWCSFPSAARAARALRRSACRRKPR